MLFNLSLWHVVGMVIIIYLLFHYQSKENLIIHGDQTVRGDPDTASPCGSGWYLPFNVGTSCPRERRRMTIGS